MDNEISADPAETVLESTLLPPKASAHLSQLPTSTLEALRLDNPSGVPIVSTFEPTQSIVLPPRPSLPPKVSIQIHALPSLTAAQRHAVLAQRGTTPPGVYKINASSPFSAVVGFLRKKLSLKEGDSCICYIGQCFAPGLDEGVGGLWECFGTGGTIGEGIAGRGLVGGRGGADRLLGIWVGTQGAFG